jgi:endoglucanase
LLFVEAALARPGLAMGAGLDVNLTGWQTEAEGYLDRIVNGEKRRGFLTRGAYCDGPTSGYSLTSRWIAVLRWRL